MVPENAESPPSKATNSDRHDLPRTSFASIQKPELADEAEDQHLLLWGRFWGQSEELAVAFLINLNLDGHHFIDEEYLLYQQPEKLEPFDTDQHFTRFKRTFEGKTSDSDFPDATRKKIQTTFRNYLDSPDNEEELVTCFKNKNREQFQDHAYDIVNQIIPTGDVIYQFKAELSTLESRNPESDQGTSGDSPEGNADEQPDEDVDYLPVTPVTSPMNGDFPGDLNVGNTVFVRTTGEVTSQLPDELQSQDHEEYSVPLEATVRSISSDIDLPDDFDGNDADYWEMTVNLFDSNVGQRFLHKNTQIKAPGNDEDHDQDSLLSPLVLVTTGIILLSILSLAYVIFGV